jgi:uncharacterized RDD family membrane protein YckC
MTASPAGARPVAGIGRRIAGYVVDQLPLLLGGAAVGVFAAARVADGSLDGALVPLAAYSVFALVYGVGLWWWLATAGLSPGKRLLGMRAVSERTGRPIGWGPAFLRQLVLGLVTVCTLGVGAIVLAAVAARDDRRRGWHDRAAGSVVLDTRAPVAPPVAVPRGPRTTPGIVPVGLPAAAAPPRAPEVAAFVAEPPSSMPHAAAAPPPGSPPPASPARSSAPPHWVPSPVSAAGSGPVAAVPGLVDDVPGIHRPSTPAPLSSPPGADDDPELTRMPGRPASGGWTLLVGGRRLPVSGPGLLGRDPQPRPGEEAALLVAVDDPQRSLSKTHLAFGVDAAGFWVCDRGSTNGTAVRAPDGTQRSCPPDTPVHVAAGSALLVGDHVVTVSGP